VRSQASVGAERLHIYRPLASMTGLVAMQKVVGSNPFSRSKEKPRSGGAFLCLNAD